MTRVLYIGGSGEISFACVEAAVSAGQHVTVFNRGTRDEILPAAVEQVSGDINDDSLYADLAARHFDTVCQFVGLNTDTISRDIATFPATVTSMYSCLRRLPIKNPGMKA